MKAGCVQTVLSSLGRTELAAFSPLQRMGGEALRRELPVYVARLRSEARPECGGAGGRHETNERHQFVFSMP